MSTYSNDSISGNAKAFITGFFCAAAFAFCWNRATVNADAAPRAQANVAQIANADAALAHRAASHANWTVASVIAPLATSWTAIRARLASDAAARANGAHVHELASATAQAGAVLPATWAAHAVHATAPEDALLADAAPQAC